MSEPVPGVVALFGATASGKSAVALELAGLVDGEVVSCDAMQLYRGLPILTNQPTPAELARVPHHLVAEWPLDADGDVARYAAAAHAAIDGTLRRSRVPIVVGGTGLYLRAALTDLALPPQPPPELRERLGAAYDRDGAAAAHARLAHVDPAAASRIHPHDRRRVVRALELAELGSSLAPADDRLFATDTRLPTRVFGLVVPRAVLHARIAGRVDAMLARGVLDEVAAAVAEREPSATAARALGLDLLRAVLRGETGVAVARDALVARTRQYARRQEIWLRRIPGLQTVDGTLPPAEAAAAIAGALAAPAAAGGRYDQAP
jgi:tRNA dimethylallyltransferase